MALVVQVNNSIFKNNQIFFYNIEQFLFMFIIIWPNKPIYTFINICNVSKKNVKVTCVEYFRLFDRVGFSLFSVCCFVVNMSPRSPHLFCSPSWPQLVTEKVLTGFSAVFSGLLDPTLITVIWLIDTLVLRKLWWRIHFIIEEGIGQSTPSIQMRNKTFWSVKIRGVKVQIP